LESEWSRVAENVVDDLRRREDSGRTNWGTLVEERLIQVVDAVSSLGWVKSTMSRVDTIRGLPRVRRCVREVKR